MCNGEVKFINKNDLFMDGKCKYLSVLSSLVQCRNKYNERGVDVV